MPKLQPSTKVLTKRNFFNVSLKTAAALTTKTSSQHQQIQQWKRHQQQQTGCGSKPWEQRRWDIAMIEVGFDVRKEDESNVTLYQADLIWKAELKRSLNGRTFCHLYEPWQSEWLKTWTLCAELNPLPAEKIFVLFSSSCLLRTIDMFDSDFNYWRKGTKRVS